MKNKRHTGHKHSRRSKSEHLWSGKYANGHVSWDGHKRMRSSENRGFGAVKTGRIVKHH